MVRYSFLENEWFSSIFHFYVSSLSILNLREDHK